MTGNTSSTPQKNRAEQHLPFSLVPAGQGLSVVLHPALEKQTTTMTTSSKYPLQPQHTVHFTKKATLLSSESHLTNCPSISFKPDDILDEPPSSTGLLYRQTEVN